MRAKASAPMGLRGRLWQKAKAHKRRLIIAAVGLAFAPLVALHVASWLVAFPSELREPHAGSVRVLDRHGRLLREVRAKDGARSAWVSRGEAQLVVDALVATEDKRFLSHHGVDYLAVMRAALANVTHGRAVSGASTLTMQLARTVRPHERTLAGKFMEAALALRIEREIGKDEIVEQYLNRVDFGPNLRGVGGASRAYFDKAPSELSLGEATLLAGAVRGPTYYDLRKRPEAAIARRRLVLLRMRDAGFTDEAKASRAADEPVVLQARSSVFGAPHFVRALFAGDLSATPVPAAATVTTTLDSELQRAAELATQRALEPLVVKHVTAASVVVIENATGDVLAYVGSPDFFDVAREGQNDGVLALRQPGSTLKPFVYELAMERLHFTPATTLPDIELHLQGPTGDFAPSDYDMAFRGPVRMREALGNSLNVPAVVAADKVGIDALLQRLRALGFALPESAQTYGAALALGDGEVSLLQLANAYATLARGGVMKAPRVTLDGKVGDETRVTDELATARITDILKDKRARLASFGEDSVLEQPFDAAGKTGTSKGYRDNWAVGYTRSITVAAWVGNFDGSAMDHVSGITGAGPLLHEVLAAAMQTREKLPLPVIASESPLERVAICPLSGMKVTDACKEHMFEWFTHAEAAELPSCELHERVRIDARNGKRAGSGSSDRCVEVVDKVFERYPPEYASWAAGANRPVAPLEYSGDCPDDGPARAATSGPLFIRSPAPDARYVIDPDRPRAIQVLPVSVVAPQGAEEVSLLVDGAPVARARSPFDLRWTLEPGDHILVARSGGQQSAPVTVHVRQ